MKVVAIQFPYVITDDEKGILIHDCVNQPRVGDRLEFNSEMQLYVVYKQGEASECVGGACGLDNIGV